MLLYILVFAVVMSDGYTLKVSPPHLEVVDGENRVVHRCSTACRCMHWGITGTLPAGIGDLKNLVLLNLRANSLAGTIPRELGRLSLASSIDLSGNALSGSLPTELGQLSKLKTLALNANKLSGSLP
jgi:hypothetical protein